MSFLARLTFALVLGLLASNLLLAPTARAQTDPLEEATRRVARQLMCPVCQGETVQDSNSGLAQDMRAVIRTKLQSGESEQQILADFVTSYGEGILTDPPKRGVSLGVWLGPIVGLVFGIVLLTYLLARWRRRPTLASAGLTPLVPDARVADELRRFREGGGV